jgi:putative nucleotidyltransferase with HDIG domain
MRPLRLSVFGSVAFLILATGWALLSTGRSLNIVSLIFLQTYRDYIFVVCAGIILGIVVYANYANIHKLNEVAEKQASAEAELHRHQIYVNSFVQTITHLNSRLDRSIVLQFICKDVTATLGVEAATLALYNPERGTLELETMHGLPQSFRLNFKPILFSSGAVKFVTQTEPVALSSPTEIPSHFPNSDLYRKLNYHGLAFVPLRYNQDFYGVLTAISLSEKTAQITSAQLKFLSAFADGASVMIRNGRLFSEWWESLKKLDALRTGDLAILSSLDLNLTLKVFLQQVTNELQADAADVLIFDPATNLLEFSAGIGFITGGIKEMRFSLGEGKPGKAALERRNIFIDDLGRDKSLIRSKLVEGEGFVSYFGMPLIAKGQLKGVLEIFRRSLFNPTDRWLSFAETLAGQASIAIDNISLYSNLQKTNTDLMIAYDRTLEGWSHALDLRDHETEGHTRRVTELCLKLAKEFSIHEDKLIQIRRGALLHDIGKMGIPDQILLKTGELNEKEKKIMEQHPTYAFEMLSPISYLNPSMDIPYCHHERWDGSGYPRGLKEEIIPFAARIFAVVDVWDALTSNRPYRNAWSKEQAAQYIREQAGKQFDPKIADTFVKMMDREE